jgi:hypothetical protein
MWCEQALKKRANNFVRSHMVLTPENDRAWIWAAFGFAD